MNKQNSYSNIPGRTNPGRFSAESDCKNKNCAQNSANKNVKPDDVPRKDGPGGE